MNIAGFDIGVCSWSLEARTTPELLARVRELGLQHVQLDLGALSQLDDKRKHQEIGLLRKSGLIFPSGMVAFPGEDYTTLATVKKTGGFVPEADFPLRRQLCKAAGQLAVEMGIDRISTHAGIVPPSNDPVYGKLVDRVSLVAEDYSAIGLTLLIESGQESAPEMLQFLNDLRTPNVQVNFDPANMILYGADDPIETILVLGRHIGHVHVKDAVFSNAPGSSWGTEVPFGSGQVPVREFLNALKEAGYSGPLMIERERGINRLSDIVAAIDVIRDAASAPASADPT